jgi:hypothetical protein
MHYEWTIIVKFRPDSNKILFYRYWYPGNDDVQDRTRLAFLRQSGIWGISPVHPSGIR